MNYIIHNKLVYQLEDTEYKMLQELKTELAQAEQLAKANDDDWMMADEHNNLNNFLAWVDQNLKPVSIESDNFDLHRYDYRCEKCASEDTSDLPF